MFIFFNKSSFSFTNVLVYMIIKSTFIFNSGFVSLSPNCLSENFMLKAKLGY